LLEKLNKRAFSEWVRNTGLEAESWSELLKISNPFLGDIWRNKIAFVQYENKMLGWAVLLEVLFKTLCAGAIGATSIQNVDQNI